VPDAHAVGPEGRCHADVFGSTGAVLEAQVERQRADKTLGGRGGGLGVDSVPGRPTSSSFCRDTAR
jgi:hypothetical protein